VLDLWGDGCFFHVLKKRHVKVFMFDRLKEKRKVSGVNFHRTPFEQEN